MRSGSPGEERSVAAGFDRGHVAGFEARGCVAHPEHTSMNGDQTAAVYSRLDFGARHPGGQELAASHDTVCPGRQLSKDFLDCPALGSHHDP